ncbi:MAG: cyclase family protein [Pseudomonadota bacterium]
MCDFCVTQAVKERMLSRRDVFKAAPMALAAGTATVMAAPPSLASGHAQVVDLTHPVTPEFPTYFGTPGIEIDPEFNFADDGFNVNMLRVREHTGTHIDAPLHFSADGQAVGEIPVANLVCPLCVVHIHEKAADDADAVVTPDDLAAWIAKNGPIPDGACVAFHSGWEEHIGTPKYRGADDAGVQHYPGFHLEAAQMLMEETGAIGLAADTLSVDIGASTTFDTHYAWLPTNRWALENVANLAEVPEAGATLIVGAPTHAGGSGGPARILALV